MPGDLLGERFVVVSFGESHGRCVGAVVEGCPAGLPIDLKEIQRDLDLRRPGYSNITSRRREEDLVEILSGVFQGYTTGAPICMLVWNLDVDSKPYEAYHDIPRPGHADYVARVKYGGYNDWRGGGRFSGRITVSYVLAGAVAKKLLRHTLGVEVLAYTLEIGGVRSKSLSSYEVRELRYSNPVRCPDLEAAEEMEERIREAQREGDSVGGIIECRSLNVPVGLGEPVFASLESDLSKALFSIPGVKGVEFGAGFDVTRMRGSESNDPYTVREGKVKTLTNKAGGILGGISTGMPIVLRVAFKPTSSIAKEQRSVNLKTMSETSIRVGGRHDPCIVPRAVPVVEAAVAMVLADHALMAGFIPRVLR